MRPAVPIRRGRPACRRRPSASRCRPGFRRIGSTGGSPLVTAVTARHVAGRRGRRRPECDQTAGRSGSRQRRARRAAGAGLAHEGDLLSVHRPDRHRVARRRRREVANRLVRREEPDEAVIAAVRHERERPAVGRPGGRLAGPAREERGSGRLRAVDRREPDLPVRARTRRACRRARSPARRRRRAASASPPATAPTTPASSAGSGCRPDWADRSAGVRSVVAAAHVDDRLAVVRKRQVRQFLAVVFAV